MITFSIKTFINWLIKLVFLIGLKERCLRTLNISIRLFHFMLYFLIYFTSLWSFSITSPRIQFCFCFLFALNIFALLYTWSYFRRHLLCFNQLFFCYDTLLWTLRSFILSDLTLTIRRFVIFLSSLSTHNLRTISIC